MKICIKNETGFQKTYAIKEKEGVTVSVKVEYIKKLMGWCPNKKIFETGSQIIPANFGGYDQSKGENPDPKILTHFPDFIPGSMFDFSYQHFSSLFFNKSAVSKGYKYRGFLYRIFTFSSTLFTLLEKTVVAVRCYCRKNPLSVLLRKRSLFLIFFTIILFLILPLFFLSSMPSLLTAKSLITIFFHCRGLVLDVEVLFPANLLGKEKPYENFYKK